ncbi:MAG: Gfo/Idh/MocA family oxidoreductase [Bacteroidota bacterium]
MTKLRIALIGAGYIAHYHMRALQQLTNVEVVGVVAKTISSAKDFAAKYNISNALDNIEKLDNLSIDAVVISTPNKFHAPYAIQCLQNGMDVLIEKPMAMNAEEAEQIAVTARKHSKLVLIGHMWHFDAETNHIKTLVESGKLGNIVKTKSYGIHENWGPEGWFTKKELAGGGALADMGVHAIETVRYILGNPQPKEVYAKISTSYGSYDVDDSGIIMITWDTGTVSLIESGWWQPHMDGPEAATGIYGTKGYAQLFPTLVKMSHEDTTSEKLPKFPAKKEHCDQIIFDAQMKHFIDCVINREQPGPGLEEGLTVMKIVDAAYKSSETAEAVRI